MNRDAKSSVPVVLTIAGFDPSGGAGIIADIRAIEMFGCAGVAAITSVTFQNAEKFLGAVHQTAESVRWQIESIVAETEIAAVKIGMLPTVEVVREVARLIRELKLPPAVIDPVMQSTTGGTLMADDAIEVFVTELLPLARVVTPNIPEAEKLSGMNIGNEEQMRRAAARIRKLGARAVLIKGGHRYRSASDRELVKETASITDMLDDSGDITVFTAQRIAGAELHGSGCILSSAIAAGLAKGMGLEDAASIANRFVTKAFQALT
jgi:hydroxymethylpyrimidine/phosphomethylpyrimidine kinase